MFKPLKTTVIAIATLCLHAGTAHADSLRTVRCANGKTVQASGTQSHRQACLTIAGQPVRVPAAKPNVHTAVPGILSTAGHTQQIGLLLPAVQKVREAAARSKDLN